MREKVEIPAVRDRDLRDILDCFGLAEKMDRGELICFSCSQALTWDNLGALLVNGEQLIPFCNLSECIEEGLRRSEQWKA